MRYLFSTYTCISFRFSIILISYPRAGKISPIKPIMLQVMEVMVRRGRLGSDSSFSSVTGAQACSDTLSWWTGLDRHVRLTRKSIATCDSSVRGSPRATHRGEAPQVWLRLRGRGSHLHKRWRNRAPVLKPSISAEPTPSPRWGRGDADGKDGSCPLSVPCFLLIISCFFSH